MTSSRRVETPLADGLRTAFELFELGIRMHRQTLRRRHPGEPADALEARVQAWLQTRPGAEQGDGVGRGEPIPSNDTVDAPANGG